MPADTVEAGLTAPTLSSAPRRIHEAIAPWVQRQPSHLAVQDAQHCLSY